MNQITKEEKIENLRKELADKNFDNRTLEHIYNFLEEFDTLFGKYVPREELIKRIKTNLNEVNFSTQFENKRIKGSYAPAEKRIDISEEIDNDAELIKSVFFHEMIHCITLDNERNICGFQKWIFDDGEIEKVSAHGASEGFVAYVTDMRNKKYSPNLNTKSYPVLLEQTANLIEFLGEDNFFDMSFNNPQNFTEELANKCDGFEDFEEFLDAFDVIWEEEDKIYKDKIVANSKEGIFLENLLGRKLHRDSYELKNAKKTIVGTYLNLLLNTQITSIEDFKSLYHKFIHYMEQLRGKLELSDFDSIFEGLEEAMQNNYINFDELIESLDKHDPEESRAIPLFKQKRFLKQYERMSNGKKLEVLDSFDTLERAGIYDGESSYEAQELLSRMLIDTGSDEIDYQLFCLLTTGLAKTMKEKKWNPDRIGLEYVDFKNKSSIYSRKLFNLFDTRNEEKRYLGTYSLNPETLMDIQQFSTNIPEQVQKDFLAEHPEMAGMILLGSETNEIIAYAGNEEYYDENGTKAETKYCKSKLEYLRENLRSKFDRLKFLIENQSPNIIIVNEVKGIKKKAELVERIVPGIDILGQIIKELAQKSSPEDIAEFLSKMADIENGEKNKLQRDESDYGDI